MRRIVVCDVGGTHARFGIAAWEAGTAPNLSDLVTLETSDHATFQAAWNEFGRRVGGALPKDLAIALAGPIGGDILKLTNNPWILRPASIRETLGVERVSIVNDFGAVAWSVPWLGAGDFHHICGPSRPLPEDGVITIVGPGTGLGVAMLLMRAERAHVVVETEGGHVDFAPLDPLEDRILAELRTSFQRVSVERLVSGRGLSNIYQALGAIEDRPLTIHDERALWSAALDGSDRFAVAALDRFCLALGAIAGDLALAQGAQAVVIAGGVGLRLADNLPRSGFGERFIAKGRFKHRMAEMPVKLITHPQPGLLGAAAAFAREHP